MTSDLLAFVREHTEILKPGEERIGAKIVDVSLHRIAIVGDPNPAQLEKLIEGHNKGADILDGNIHQYTNVAHLLGMDEKTAANLMGLMSATGIADLQTPRTLIDPDLSEKDEKRYRESGMLWVSQKLTKRFREALAERGQAAPRVRPSHVPRASAFTL